MVEELIVSLGFVAWLPIVVEFLTLASYCGLLLMRTAEFVEMFHEKFETLHVSCCGCCVFVENIMSSPKFLGFSFFGFLDSVNFISYCWKFVPCTLFYAFYCFHHLYFALFTLFFVEISYLPIWNFSNLLFQVGFCWIFEIVL